MYSYEYPRPSVTATIFAFYNGMVVVGTRSDDSDAYPGFRSIPAGFLNAKTETYEGETAEEAAIREYLEECGVELDGDQFILFHEHSNPDTDPRAHVVNLCYIVNLRQDQVERLIPGDDLKAIDLVPMVEAYSEPANTWAFNHQNLLKLAVHVWTHGGDYFSGRGQWAA